MNMDTPEFTLGEAARLAGISETNLRNYQKRGLSLGRKHRLGRWEFTGRDVVALSVLRHLMGLGFSEESAKQVVSLYMTVPMYQQHGHKIKALFLSSEIDSSGNVLHRMDFKDPASGGLPYLVIPIASMEKFIANRMSEAFK